MSGDKEAGELYLAADFPSKSSRTGFDISPRLETKMTGSVSFCKRRSVGTQRKVACCSVYVYQLKQEVSINNHITPLQSEFFSFQFEQLYTLWFLSSWVIEDHCYPRVSPQFSTEYPWGVFSSAIHGCRCNPSEPRCHKTVFAEIHFPPVMTSPFLFLFFLYFSLSRYAWDIRVDIGCKDFIHPCSHCTQLDLGMVWVQEQSGTHVMNIFSLYPRTSGRAAAQRGSSGSCCSWGRELGEFLPGVLSVHHPSPPWTHRPSEGVGGGLFPFVLMGWIIHVFLGPLFLKKMWFKTPAVHD